MSSLDHTVSPSDAGPLSGYRVVDLTENMAGPMATMVLGDQGADVVKVESLWGDQIRRTGSGRDGMAAYFANLNRSKRSIALDLLRPEGQAVLQRLFDGADVVVHAYRPAAARKLGIDQAAVCTPERSRLVYCEIVGFGRDGPLAGRAVYDHVIQALSGFAALQSDPATGVPSLIRQGVVDKATGLTVAQAVTAALLRRARTGAGEPIVVTMLDVALNFLWPDGMMNNTAFEVAYTRPPAANTYRLTKTADGHISLMVLTEDQWAALHPALNLDPPGERTYPERLREARERLAGMQTADAIEALTSHDIPCAPVLSLEEVPFHPQVVANEALEVFDHPVLGPIRQPVPVPRLEGMETKALRTAPKLGEHSVEILQECGYEPAEIEGLLAAKVVGVP
ncbi:MAG TPA: CoA transferase [Acidimicrobiales bacterium]|nr:CoA transferase [Acidimicrobiales bacterium]